MPKKIDGYIISTRQTTELASRKPAEYKIDPLLETGVVILVFGHNLATSGVLLTDQTVCMYNEWVKGRVGSTRGLVHKSCRSYIHT